MNLPRIWQVAFLMLVCSLQAPAATADEGMWLFNNPPRKQLKEKYGFEQTDAWLKHLQQAAVRFNSGGSGSFVSANGLVMTNHHVGADALQKLSSADKDYLKGMQRFFGGASSPKVSAPDWFQTFGHYGWTWVADSAAGAAFWRGLRFTS